MGAFRSWFMNYGLVASILVSTALVAVLAYCLDWVTLALADGGAGLGWDRDSRGDFMDQEIHRSTAQIARSRESGVKDDMNALCARRTRTIKRCSSDVRSRSQPLHPLWNFQILLLWEGEGK